VNDAVKALPILIGPKNAEAVTGTPWRHVRDHAALMGVRLLRIGRKYVVRADEYLAALDRAAANASKDAPGTCATAPSDPAAAVRDLLGVRLRAGGAA
jgi:hypothetical protein